MQSQLRIVLSGYINNHLSRAFGTTQDAEDATFDVKRVGGGGESNLQQVSNKNERESLFAENDFLRR